MSVSVVTDGRNYHWESASKPALSRCHYRLPPLSLPHLHHHRHHHLHHRPRRRHFSGDTSPPPWPRRTSEGSAPSFVSSWHADDHGTWLTADSFLFGGGSGVPSFSTAIYSSLSSSSSSSSSSSCLSAEGLRLSPPALFLTRDPIVAPRKMSSSSGGPRNASASLEASGNTSTAAAREVKQYLNRTLFPRPSSTLHGYASLYHRLKKLPGTHRKVRQRGKTAPPLDSSSSKGPGMVSGRQLEEAATSTDSELEDIDVDPLEDRMRAPPRVEIHIYVPTGGHHDDDPSAHHFTS